jgi:hypothetical protein
MSFAAVVIAMFVRTQVTAPVTAAAVAAAPVPVEPSGPTAA